MQANCVLEPSLEQSSVEKEVLAMVMAVPHFRVYLYGHGLPQQSIMPRSLKDPQPKLSWWIIELGEYDFDVEYRAGLNNGNADALSRWPLEGKEIDSMVAWDGDEHDELTVCALQVIFPKQ